MNGDTVSGHAVSESLTPAWLDDVELHLAWASRITPDSPSRKALRRILAEHDLDIAQMLLHYRMSVRSRLAVPLPPQ